MHDAYKMVIINIVCSMILLAGLGVYRFIYPKKKINLLVLLLLLCIIPTISIFRPGAYQSGDFNIHIYRTISFYNSLHEGHFLPSWAAELNATYGYPLFIFNYPLPYYFIIIFHVIGFSYIMSMKLFLATTFIASGIFMYFAAKEFFKNDFAAFTAAIFYEFTPYHLIDQNFKVVIGELLIFMVLPLVFLLFQKLLHKRTPLLFALSGIVVALLIMAHVLIALFVMGLLFIYSCFLTFKSKKVSYVIVTFISFLLGSLGSVYIWLTPLFMTKYTILSKLQLNPVDFITISQLLFTPWRLGLLFQGPNGEIGNLIGYTELFVLILFSILLVKKKIAKKYNSDVLFWLISTIVICFLITEYADFIWKLFPLIAITGSHRFFILIVFCISILGGYLALFFPKKRKLLFFLLFITVYSTILNWGQRTVIPSITDRALIQNMPYSTAQGEAHFYANSIYRNPKNQWFSKIPKNYLNITHGNGQVKNIKHASTDHSYVINARTNLQVRDNTLYFPGWQVYADNKLVPIGHDSEGIISFSLPKGLHYVEVEYTDILVYRILKIISMTSLLIYVAYIIVYFIRIKLKLKLRLFKS